MAWKGGVRGSGRDVWRCATSDLKGVAQTLAPWGGEVVGTREEAGGMTYEGRREESRRTKE
eukprot:2838881-Pyramimonas_sp.AAC.1